jgi:hypothetical protein
LAANYFYENGLLPVLIHGPGFRPFLTLFDPFWQYFSGPSCKYPQNGRDSNLTPPPKNGQNRSRTPPFLLLFWPFWTNLTPPILPISLILPYFTSNLFPKHKKSVKIVPQTQKNWKKLKKVEKNGKTS